jgi:hypothetical protein
VALGSFGLKTDKLSGKIVMIMRRIGGEKASQGLTRGNVANDIEGKQNDFS